MGNAWIPSLEEIERMPAGDRGPRLRALMQRHRDALAAVSPLANDTASRQQRTRHAQALASLEHFARVLGVEACLKRRD